MSAKTEIVPLERIEGAILMIRGQKVLLDRNLALLYGVETRVLNQSDEPIPMPRKLRRIRY